MSNIPDTDEFVVDEIGETTADSFQGKFTVKTILSHREQLRRDEMRRLYLGAFNQASPSPRANNQADLFSDINVRIVDASKSCPSWWRDADMGIDLKDDNVILSISKAMTACIEKRQKLVDEAIAEKRKGLKGMAAAGMP